MDERRRVGRARRSCLELPELACCMSLWEEAHGQEEPQALRDNVKSLTE